MQGSYQRRGDMCGAGQRPERCRSDFWPRSCATISHRRPIGGAGQSKKNGPAPRAMEDKVLIGQRDYSSCTVQPEGIEEAPAAPKFVMELLL